MTVIPAVKRNTFFSVRFSEHLDILIEDIKMIDFSALRTHLDNKSKAFRVGPLYVSVEEMFIEFCGILLSCEMWLACSNTSETVTLPLECSKERVYQTFEYLYHLFN